MSAGTIHYDRIYRLHNELLGFIEGTCEGADADLITANQALDKIREKAAETDAAIEASWNELLGGAS